MTESIYLNAVIGDALGRSCEGLSRGHLRERVRSFTDYIDSSALLKGNIDKWTKPGLYSGNTQLMFLVALSSPRGYLNRQEFGRMLALARDPGYGAAGIFRRPHRFLNQIQDDRAPVETRISKTATFILPAALPLATKSRGIEELSKNIIELGKACGCDTESIAAALAFAALINSALSKDRDQIESPMVEAMDANNTLCSIINDSPDKFFSLGINPDAILEHCMRLECMLRELAPVKNTDRGEQIICSLLNKTLKSPVTRATVDHPFALYCYALLLLNERDAHGQGFLHYCACRGGSTTVLTAIVAALMFIFFENSCYHDSLVKNLVNKKFLNELTGSLEKGVFNETVINKFIDGEAALTKKENEEASAKARHAKTEKKDHEKSSRKKDSDLSRHIVESWTKIDRARWKKERKKYE